jgi:hypothetical protein
MMLAGVYTGPTGAVGTHGPSIWVASALPGQGGIVTHRSRSAFRPDAAVLEGSTDRDVAAPPAFDPSPPDDHAAVLARPVRTGGNLAPGPQYGPIRVQPRLVPSSTEATIHTST